MWLVYLAVFVFSSRSRHTTSDRDWSSDVCSSDLRRGGLLISLLVLPFYVPVLIFGVSASRAALVAVPGDLGGQSLLLLGAVSLASLVVGPVGGAAALRVAVK